MSSRAAIAPDPYKLIADAIHDHSGAFAISPEFAAMRAMVQQALMNANRADWTVQGFGMMRTYFGPDKRFRLNVWNSALAVPGVSTVHDHPWSLRSWIINGEVRNRRYHIADERASLYDYMVIKTGEGGGPDGPTCATWLYATPDELYQPGHVYSQTPTEIHESICADGTVTLNDRTRVGDGEHARVFWPHGQRWVDAEPRAANDNEIGAVIGDALDKWTA